MKQEWTAIPILGHQHGNVPSQYLKDTLDCAYTSTPPSDLLQQQTYKSIRPKESSHFSATLRHAHDLYTQQTYKCSSHVVDIPRFSTTSAQTSDPYRQATYTRFSLLISKLCLFCSISRYARLIHAPLARFMLSLNLQGER